MELRQLRFLLALAEERRFGRAAARMHISQPSLSQEIRRLERELGVVLFARTSRQVLLTPTGQSIVTLAKETLAAADRLRDTAAAAARGETGTLRVGFVPTTAPAFLPHLLREFRDRYPDTTIDLYAAGLADPSAGLGADRVDVALIWPPISVSGLEQRPLLREPRVAVVAADHPFAGREGVRFADLADEPTCVVETDDPAWNDFWLLTELRNGRPPVRGPITTSLDGALAAVAAGVAVAFPPAGSKAFGSGLPVVAVPVAGLPPAVLAAAWPLSGNNPATEPFVALAEELAAEWR